MYRSLFYCRYICNKFCSSFQPQSDVSNQSVSVRDLTEIPPLPDLTDLKMNRSYQPPALLQLNRSKQRFNLRKKMAETFGKPLSKSFLITPMHRGPEADFLKSVISCRVSAYDQMSIPQINITMPNNVCMENKANETMGTGFTKQQLNRLLSTKKSSSKKFRRTTVRPDKKIKKLDLFNESTMSTINRSICLTRCHSSPNLLEIKERTCVQRLSTMKENSLSVFEVSGIVALNRDSNQSTPRDNCSLEISRKVSDFNSMPSITGISSKTGTSSKTSLNEIANKEVEIEAEAPKRNNTELFEEPKSETPVSNLRLIKKTGSLEKIINRFKKIRASVLPEVNLETKDFKTIDEEKENLNMANELFKANKNLLPDLLSPSCSTITQRSDDRLECWFDSDNDKVDPRRESLGTALGVDHTFLDQFDLDSD